MVFLLDTEARNRQVHVISGHLVHRIVIAALLPRRSHAEFLAQPGDPLCRGNAAHLRDAAAHEVDQPLAKSKVHTLAD